MLRLAAFLGALEWYRGSICVYLMRLIATLQGKASRPTDSLETPPAMMFP
jgi:hypothetical protein